MIRPKNLLVLAIAALFALSACGDDSGETGNQNDFNVGEQDAGPDDTGDDDTDDAGPTGDADHEEDTGVDADDLVVPADTGQDEDTGGDDESGWPDPNGDDHSNPPAEPECMENLDHMTACGGYGKGTWENAEVCTDFDIEEALEEFDCEGADVQKFDYWVVEGSGTLTLTDDTYERDLQIVIDAEAFIPENCLEFMGFPITCDDFSAGAQEFLDLHLDCQPGDAPAPEGPGCDCVIDEQILDRSGTGVLTVEHEENLLRFSEEGTYYYCAEDGVLNLRTTSSQDIPMTESYTFAE